MSQIGLGVMIGILSGNENSVEAWKKVVGKKLTEITVKDHQLTLKTDDGGVILSDEGQSCCESRYMVCDDKLENFIGAELMDATVEDGPDINNEHEVQFLHVKTSKGSFTVSNHNEHNGYYGGFCIRACIRAREL